MVIWQDVIKGFTQKEEKCLISLIENGHDNCFTRETIKEVEHEGFSISEIYSVIEKLQKKNLCYKIPQNIFSIMWDGYMNQIWKLLLHGIVIKINNFENINLYFMNIIFLKQIKRPPTIL